MVIRNKLLLSDRRGKSMHYHESLKVSVCFVHVCFLVSLDLCLFVCLHLCMFVSFMFVSLKYFLFFIINVFPSNEETSFQPPPIVCISVTIQFTHYKLQILKGPLCAASMYCCMLVYLYVCMFVYLVIFLS